jgi:hypothetical protein
MPKPQLRGFAEPVRECLETVGVSKPLDSGELALRRAARSHEIRVVGVREAVRARSRLGDDRTLFERQDRLRRPHEREQ